MVLAVAMVVSMVLPVYAASDLPYSDVSEDDWYYEAVCLLYEEGLIKGTDEEDGSDSFYPDSAAAKEWVTVLLYRIAGSPSVSGMTSFSDVESRSWYVDAVIWAEMNGIAEGNEDGTFGVGEAVTVEEFAVFLYRYSEYWGYDTSDSADLSAYPDADEVSSSAEEAMEWAVAEGIIQGVEIDGETCLAPGNEIPRAGVAVVFCRYLGYLDDDVVFDDPGYDYVYTESSTTAHSVYADEIYTDVTEEDWYYDLVSLFCSEGLLPAYKSETVFNGTSAATREWVIYLFYCLDGSPEAEGTSSFSDVVSRTWYEDAVIWAEQNDIARGNEDGTFGVGEPVTVEELALLLYRYSEYWGYDTSASADLSVFPDGDEVSSSMEEAVEWAVAEGLIRGRTMDGAVYLAPGSVYSRIGTLVILCRYTGYGWDVPDGTYVDEDDMYVDETDTDSESEDGSEDLTEDDAGNSDSDSVIDTEAEEESGSSLSYDDFTDLDDSASWYYEGVNYVIENGIMNGTSSSTFNPDGTCTRSMIVTILYRLAGSPPVEGISSFDDVEENQWYTDAIIWAEQEQITTGVSSTLFNVNGTLTREQFATFLYRYAQYMNQDTSVSGDLSSFSDYYEVNDWAEDAMCWAVDKELITGSVKNGEIVLAPTDSCTRAMAAVIIWRFET